MRDNTFTPGPWRVNRHSPEDPAVYSKKFMIADCFEHNQFTREEAHSNARLIAAAPDMYDALWETIELSDRNLTEAGRTPECQRVYDIVRAALKKAEGE